MTNSNTATSRAEALALGNPFYIGPKPCKRGHDPAIRRTGSKACHACALEYDRDKRANDPARQESERKRKRALKARQKAQGAFNWEAKRKSAARRRERLRNSPKAIAAREARQAEQEVRRAEKQRQKELRALDKELRAIRSAQNQLQHQRNKSRQRRALKRGASGKVSNAELEVLKQQQGNQCAYCGDTIAHLDHKTSVANGGQHEIDNLQWLCAPCNLTKHAMNDSDYRAHKGIASLTPWDSMAGRALWLGIIAIG